MRILMGLFGLATLATSLLVMQAEKLALTRHLVFANAHIPYTPAEALSCIALVIAAIGVVFIWEATYVVP